ncbi:MAG: putative urea ABC transporter substrate-binding protein [Chromatiaceae bacterium]|jgi:NitT/TauT family transport system substrate-binding protein|nr:putative urea ABC transporter substrate-binding protein [Chromatiaceae bacterium]
MKRTLPLLFIALLGLAGAADAAERYRVAWSHYTGWEPWGYADYAGILKKWADKEGIEIELTLVNDYIESINLYTSGHFDACTMTNMDALTIPAVGGVDSTALIVGDFSDGNDGIVMKNGASVVDLKGRTINLVELSVSHYMLARALDMNGLSERDVTLVNTSDADIAALFAADPNGAVVTWNPPLQQVRNVQGAELVFDSSKIPGEIIDLMVVKTDAPDSLEKALVGAWYETMTVLSGTGNVAKEAVEYMAGAAGATVAEFKAQLRTTAMFYDPAKAADFARSDKVKETMDYVRRFSFDKGLYGEGAPSADLVGISYPDGSVAGDANNVKLRFDADHMAGAATAP